MTDETEVKHFRDGMFERMQGMNRAWIERLRQIRQIEGEYGARLLGAKTSHEATAICNEWMAKRLEVVAGEQQAFVTAWLQLVSGVLKSTSESPAVASEETRKRA
jgi:hypothetical protein